MAQRKMAKDTIQHWMLKTYKLAVEAGLENRPVAFSVQELYDRMSDNQIIISIPTIRASLIEMERRGIAMRLNDRPRVGRAGSPTHVYALVEVLDKETSSENTVASEAKSVISNAETFETLETGSDDSTVVDSGSRIRMGDDIVPGEIAESDTSNHPAPVIPNQPITSTVSTAKDEKLSRSQRRAGTKAPGNIKDETFKIAANAFNTAGPNEHARAHAINAFAAAFNGVSDSLNSWGDRQAAIGEVQENIINALIALDAKLAVAFENIANVSSGMDDLNNVGVNFKFSPGIELATMHDVRESYKEGFAAGWKMRGEIGNG